jgi:hypothetical protein
MSSLHRAITLLIFMLLLAACQAQPAVEPTATPEPAPVVTDTPVVVDTPTPPPTETPAPTPTPEPSPTPEPTETPVPEVALNFVEYTSEFAGLTLSYPEEWVVFDFFFLILASHEEILDLMMEGALTDESVAFDRGAILIAVAGDAEGFTIADPLELLEEFVDDMEDIDIVEGPTDTVINGQDATRLLVRGRVEEMEVMILSVVIHNTESGRSAALLGMTPIDGADEYLPILQAIIETAEILEEGAFD